MMQVSELHYESMDRILYPKYPSLDQDYDIKWSTSISTLWLDWLSPFQRIFGTTKQLQPELHWYLDLDSCLDSNPRYSASLVLACPLDNASHNRSSVLDSTHDAHMKVRILSDSPCNIGDSPLVWRFNPKFMSQSSSLSVYLSVPWFELKLFLKFASNLGSDIEIHGHMMKETLQPGINSSPFVFQFNSARFSSGMTSMLILSTAKPPPLYSQQEMEDPNTIMTTIPPSPERRWQDDINSQNSDNSE